MSESVELLRTHSHKNVFQGTILEQDILQVIRDKGLATISDVVIEILGCPCGHKQGIHSRKNVSEGNIRSAVWELIDIGLLRLRMDRFLECA